jgi:hypothetical protein
MKKGSKLTAVSQHGMPRPKTGIRKNNTWNPLVSGRQTKGGKVGSKKRQNRRSNRDLHGNTTQDEGKKKPVTGQTQECVVC